MRLSLYVTLPGLVVVPITASLAALRDKGQRTVYRLTLVKTWNMEEVDEYCKLIGVGQPDFIEIKVRSAACPWHKPCDLHWTYCNTHVLYRL